MLEFSNGGYLATSIHDTPELPRNTKRLYLDFETSSGDPKLSSTNPWWHCSVIGAAVTFDDWPRAVFMTRDILRHWVLGNLPKCEVWINHNVKYDAHVLFNDLGIEWNKPLHDTVTYAKLLDSDRTFKGGYGLDALAQAWIGRDMSLYYEALKPYLYDHKGRHVNQDYGKIPLDLLAEYACEDVLANRELYHYELAQMPADMAPLVQTETEITTVLLNMERRGLKIDPDKVQQKELVSKYKMMTYAERLKDIVGYEINPVSGTDVYDVLCNRYGLPVLAWTNEDDDKKKSNPSFDADAMQMYLAHPESPKEVVKLIIGYRKESTMNSLFWEPWQKLHVNGVLHADYNQNVRSGRMSCKEPNEQQLNEEAKECVEPRDGHAFVSHDASQIEYRLIVDYAGIQKAIKAYCENPDTDFHEWAGELCDVTRKAGKTVNFSISFGQGKGKTINALYMYYLEEGKDRSRYESMALASAAYDTYHKEMPELKRTSHEASMVCRRRGFVFNRHRRRLHMPQNRSHIAFNRIIQSDAADIMKERVVATEKLKLGYLNAIVHDEVLHEVPIELVEKHQPLIQRELEDTKGYRVPIRWTLNGMSTESWGACKTK